MVTQSKAIEFGDTALTKVAADLGMGRIMHLPHQTSRPDPELPVAGVTGKVFP